MMRPRLALLLLALPAAAPAQAPPLRQLTTPAATFPEPFTAITGFRALSDGRVIVSDSRDRTVQLLDLRTGAATAIGREGGGPGEYGMPTRLYPLPGDSTVMPDPMNGRYFLILPNGRPGTTFRLDDEVLANAGSLVGVDAQGRMIFERVRPPTGGGPMATSSGVSDILRHDRRTGRTDSLAQLATPAGERSAARMLDGGMLQMSTNLPLAARDVVAVVPLGETAIVRASPYHVDRATDPGALRSGPRAEPSRVRVTQAEREAFVRGQIRPGSIITSSGAAAGGAPAGRDRGASRGGAIAITGDISALFTPDMTWPDIKPPFLGGAALADWSGRVWVLRTRAHDDPVPTFDVFDRTGRVVMRVAIAPRARVVGFSRDAVFIARSDEDDLLHLERHPLP
jgi:hypothetical protein